ncbi:MAG TPA: NAD(P)-dependent alcohol dehydrogenase [Microbacteriaceae bacterium]
MLVSAAVARDAGALLQLAELELDELRPDEVRVHMVATGVCHTDALVRDQVLPTPLPVVLGHEGAGVVDAVGAAVMTVEPGDHVVLGFNSCGTCAQCRAGHPAYCAAFPALNFGGVRADGTTSLRESGASGTAVSSHFFGQSSFATYANVAARSVVKVPQDAPLELLGPLGCGISTGAGTVLNALQPPAGSAIVIFGAGAVGCSALLAAVVAGCSEIILVDVVPARLEFAQELGATHAINGWDEDAVAAIRRITGDGAQYAVDTTGNQRVFRQMVQSLAVRGSGALVGAAPEGTEATLDIGALLVRSPVISGVIEGDAVPQTFIPLLIDLYQAGRFPFDRLIERYDFSDINRAFADSARGETVKPVVVF